MEGTIWHDRKRILGLPISFTRYYLKNDKLIHSHGFFFVRESELMLYRVLDVEIKYSLLDRIMGIGTVIVYGADVTHSKFYIRHVKNPRQLLGQLNELIETEKLKWGVKGKELFGSMNSVDSFNSACV